MEKTKTELHTHLLGMLSARGLLEMVKEYTDYIYYPLDKAIGEETEMVRIDTLLSDDSALDALRIKTGTSVDYEELNRFYMTRTAIVNYLVSIMALSDGKKPVKFRELVDNKELFDAYENFYSPVKYQNESIIFAKAILECAKNKKMDNPLLDTMCKKDVFNNYLHKSLLELIDMGVEYVEISYSYENIISLIELDQNILNNKIKCKFLLSTSRDRNIKNIRESVEDLKEALAKNMTVGFDIMGEELPLTDLEKMYSTSKHSKSFKRKLELIIDGLIENEEEYNTLRIHSGETEESFGNTEWILDTLSEIKKEYKEKYQRNILPPPELRIGHGLYFDKDNESYFKRLRSFKAIVEINASSNVALGNVGDYFSLPYNIYLSHKIPVVISTDGHGLYDTSIPKEDEIASDMSSRYEKIVELDSIITRHKKGR